jgi:hypothetical protein
MKYGLSVAARVLISLLAIASIVMSQERSQQKPRYFSGTISDYTPSNITPAGPWEVRGTWSLRMDRDRDKASFSAALVMVLSDFTRTPANVDSTSGPTSRMQHTHHITIEDGTVTPLPNGGFELAGIATITKDGSPAPLQPATLHVQITGGTLLEYSNLTMQFDVISGGPTIHFGTQTIHGVVRTTR